MDNRAPVVRIQSGLHAGAECVIPGRPFTIGGEAPADIILHDEGVAPIHLVLEPDGHDLRLCVRAAGVSIEGTSLDIDDTVITALPADIRLGTVAIRCEPSSDHRPELPSDQGLPRRDFRAILRSNLVKLTIVGTLSISLVSGIALRAASSDEPARPHSFRTFPRLLHPAVTDAVVPGLMQIDNSVLRHETGQQLQAHHLVGIDLDASAGIVIAHGTIDPQALPRLHAVELWFDRRFGEHAVFVSEIKAQESPPFSLALDAVWAGPDPNIIVHRQKYFVGATLPDGTIVERITPQRVFLRQGSRQYAAGY